MDDHIYDNSGKLLGTIKHQGGMQYLYSATGQHLGQYSGGYTYDARGGLVGSGNLLTMLL